jgi:hypothetical protein
VRLLLHAEYSAFGQANPRFKDRNSIKTLCAIVFQVAHTHEPDTVTLYTVPTNALGKKHLIILTAENLRMLSSFDAEMSKLKIYPVKVGKGIKWFAKQYLPNISEISRGSR